MINDLIERYFPDELLKLKKVSIEIQLKIFEDNIFPFPHQAKEYCILFGNADQLMPFLDMKELEKKQKYDGCPVAYDYSTY